MGLVAVDAHGVAVVVGDVDVQVAGDGLALALLAQSDLNLFEILLIIIDYEHLQRCGGGALGAGGKQQARCRAGREKVAWLQGHTQNFS